MFSTWLARLMSAVQGGTSLKLNDHSGPKLQPILCTYKDPVLHDALTESTVPGYLKFS